MDLCVCRANSFHSYRLTTRGINIKTKRKKEVIHWSVYCINIVFSCVLSFLCFYYLHFISVQSKSMDPCRGCAMKLNSFVNEIRNHLATMKCSEWIRIIMITISDHRILASLKSGTKSKTCWDTRKPWCWSEKKEKKRGSTLLISSHQPLAKN